ncbi:MAG: hypothetical protein ACIAQZ_14060 [Sedimentisphaeraceae bacterium JB056]
MFALRLLAIRPLVKIEDGRVRISTAIIFRLISLFLRIRSVEVCRDTQSVTISSRILYFFKKSKVIRFGQIRCLDYTYKEVEDLDFSGRRYDYSRDTYEIFTILIRTVDEDKVVLAKYYGEGGRTSNWLFDRYHLDWIGTQSEDSREVAERISEIMDMPIGNRVTKTVDYKSLLLCAECGRPSPNSFDRCQYCGGELC